MQSTKRPRLKSLFSLWYPIRIPWGEFRIVKRCKITHFRAVFRHTLFCVCKLFFLWDSQLFGESQIAFWASIQGSLSRLAIVSSFCFIYQKIRTIGNMFVLNLAVADLLVCSVLDSAAVSGRSTASRNNRKICTNYYYIGINVLQFKATFQCQDNVKIKLFYFEFKVKKNP